MREHRYATIIGSGPVRRVALENTLHAPIATVWETITTVELMQQWWPDWRPGGIVEQRVGGRIVLDDGSWIDGRITIWNPPHILAFTWNDHLANPDDVPWFEPATQSALRIDLVEDGRDATRLFLVQYMPHDHAVGGAAGWHHFAGERLKALLETGRVEDDPTRFNQLKALYSQGADV